MANDQRIYSDEEFALILRKASELVTPAEQRTEGFTLAEMKTAAAQAGFNPALIERAARLLAVPPASSFERLLGGPLRHQQAIRLPVSLDEDSAARLLSAVRISANLAGRHDVGHSGAMGMTWHDGGETESLSITARPDEEGTAVSVTLDRRATFGLVSLASGMGMFFAVLFSASALYPEAAALGYGGGIVGVAGALAGARHYWALSTTRARKRIEMAMDTISEALSGPKRPSLEVAPPSAETAEDVNNRIGDTTG